MFHCQIALHVGMVIFRYKEREMATPLPLSESLAEGGFEPLIAGSLHKNLTIVLSCHLDFSLFFPLLGLCYRSLGPSSQPEQLTLHCRDNCKELGA